MVKVTFSVDKETVLTLKATADRLRKPQSMVVREAIADYAARAGRLTESERRRMLRVVDEMVKLPRSRPQAQVDKELRHLRRARKHGGRRHRAE
jgi:ribosomal protein S13